MDNLRAAGIAPISTSGNRGSRRTIDFPGCISGVVSVGSVNGGATPEGVSGFSNSSPQLDLLAPGLDIRTSVPGGGFDSFQGTSMAAPHVAGAWAVLRSKAPTASLEEMLSVLSRTGIPVTDSRNGLVRPRIQVDAALDALLPQMSYASGTRLTLTARPEPGYRFTLWRGCEDEDGNRCTVAIDAPRRITAVFEPVGGNHPDLVTTSLTGPRSATAGSPAPLTASVRNQGDVAAGPFRLGFYLSADPEITADDTWFAACTYEEGLDAGQTATCRPGPFPSLSKSPPAATLWERSWTISTGWPKEARPTTRSRPPPAPIEVLAPRFSSRSFHPGHPERRGPEGLLLHLRADPHQPGKPRGPSRLHLHGPCRRGAAAGPRIPWRRGSRRSPATPSPI